MKWFKHDSDARNSLKLRKVRRKFGAEGYAIYWFCLEAIAYEIDKDNLTFELKEDVETIAFELSMQESRVEEIMLYFVNQGLFESSSGVISCLKLAERIDKSMTNSPKMRRWLDAQNVMTRVDSVMSKDDSVSTCAELDKNRLDKNRKEKIKDIDQQAERESKKIADNDFIENLFDQFWDSGIRKAGKKAAKSAFKKILSKKVQKQEFTDYLIRDIQFRLTNEQQGFDLLHPTTYLNGERWTDEKLTRSNQQNSRSKQTSDVGEFDFLDDDTGWMQEICEKRGIEFQQAASGGGDAQREFESIARAKTGLENLSNEEPRELHQGIPKTTFPGDD